MNGIARTRPDSTGEMYDWNDPGRYEWVIRGIASRHRIIRLVGPFIGIVLILPVFCFFATDFVAAAVVVVLRFIYSVVVTTTGAELYGGDGELSAALRLLVGISTTAMLVLLTSYNSWLVWRGAPKKSHCAQFNLDELLTSSIGIMIFVLSYLMPSGFRGSVSSLEQWVRFFAQHALPSIPLDFTEILDVRFSDIEPYTWYARLGTIFFSFLITAGLVNFLWLVYKRRYFDEIVTGTVKECFWKCQNLLDRDTLELCRKGKIELLEHLERPVALVDFIEALDEQDFRDERLEKRPSVAIAVKRRVDKLMASLKSAFRA